eukprot:CAMPEP_0174694774 /NCGR_PEP_ID=MMETSP1094-20130205/1296_1 /TAXON_ID=156173 /ORGANISM="Chrysochromulina brevifilum, Strain UTEX LB 985" /LENGTH=395 /DNA_ID=CAMNT_0015891101 /DNA_START=18 /DNA_END=1205 /DNA_ORIENTATION=+
MASRVMMAVTLPAIAVAMTASVTRPMLMRQIGNSDLLVSECSLGGMTWGHQNTQEQAAEQLNLAFESGVNFLDTAEGYPVPIKPETAGLSDLAIAKWMATERRPRDSVILSSKVCGYNDRYTWFRENGEGTQLSKAQIHESVDKSLKRLNTDHLDLLTFHWPERPIGLTGGEATNGRSREETPFATQVEAIGELIAAGKIRHWGLSNENAHGVGAFLQACNETGVATPVCVQSAYSLLQRGDERELIASLGFGDEDSHLSSAISYLPYSPLCGGVLSGKYAASAQKPSTTPKRSRRLGLVKGYENSFLTSKAPAAVQSYVAVARKHGLTPAQLAIALCNSRQFVASTVIGATSLEQLAENLEGFRVEWTAEMEADVLSVYNRIPDPWRVQVAGMG